MVKNDRWITPPEIFDPLNKEFNFDLDAAADGETARLPRFLWDALILDSWPGNRIWLNPPYGKMLAPFVRKAFKEARDGKIVVALIPFRCSASWWHECVINFAWEVRCIRRRPKFLYPDGKQAKLTGTCDSCIVIWNGASRKESKLVSFDPYKNDRH